MSPAIIDLDAHRPHYTITTHDGKGHVVPARFFEDVASGKRSIDDLADRDDQEYASHPKTARSP